jgi:hypothetical protein
MPVRFGFDNRRWMATDKTDDRQDDTDKMYRRQNGNGIDSRQQNDDDESDFEGDHNSVSLDRQLSARQTLDVEMNGPATQP